jgi:hypothetical protein
MREISFSGTAAPASREKEETKHTDAIRKLAEELCVPAEEVRTWYEQALERFKEASIRDYVPIFVSRNVKEKLKPGNC